MEIDLQSLAPREAYHFMIQAILPRPVAWVLSDNGTGNFNLAPFSYFNGVTSRPPMISISIGRKRDGSKKDTWRNIEERGHFVVHIASADMAPLVSATSASLPFGESEAERNRIELVRDSAWPLPRVAKARIALLCHRHGIVEIGDEPQGLLIGRILRAHVAEEVAAPGASAAPSISALALNPLARLGGDDYAAIAQPFTVHRPA